MTFVKDPLSHLSDARVLAAILATLVSNTAHAQGTSMTSGGVRGVADSTFNSPVFKGMVENFQRQSTALVNSIGGAAIERAKAALPKAAELGRLRYGTHNVVSNDGETIVSWMIAVAQANPADQQNFLTKLGDLAAHRNPEAQTFMGFTAEYGLWGTPQSTPRAMQLYRAAAALNYQPAIYDLAIAAAYGKDGRADINHAAALINEANAIGSDASGRICGFGAFLSYRQRDRQQAMRYARSCWSDLASIPKALYDSQVTPSQQVTLLRESIATGLDDGYSLLERVTRDAGADPQYLGCKYTLVNRYRHALVGNTLRTDALTCYRQSTPTLSDPKLAFLRANTVVPGIVGFVPVEIHALENLRSSNQFHYAWGVPYLPFRQEDVDLFAPFVTHTNER